MSGAFAVDIGGKTRKGDVSAWMGVASNGSAAVIIVISGLLEGNWSLMLMILVGCSLACVACSFLIISYDRTKFAPGSGNRAALLA